MHDLEDERLSSLECKTRIYWTISLIANGIREGEITVEDAMRILNRLLGRLGEHRRLYKRATKLKEDIILGKVRRVV